MSELNGVKPVAWPDAVAPPNTHGWEQSAAKWLFQRVPGEWQGGRNGRQYRQYPLMLARDAYYLVSGHLESLRKAYRTTRAELSEYFQPEQIDEQLAMYAEEGPRLERLRQQILLVHDALAGVRWVPRKADVDSSKQ